MLVTQNKGGGSRGGGWEGWEGWERCARKCVYAYKKIQAEAEDAEAEDAEAGAGAEEDAKEEAEKEDGRTQTMSNCLDLHATDEKSVHNAPAPHVATTMWRVAAFS